MLSAFMRGYAKREAKLERERDALREERDEAIRRAHQGGMTMDEIAAVVGLSQQRVSQIIRRG